MDDARRTTRVLSGLATLGGIGVAFASPAHGIAITMMGAYSFFTAGANEVEISDRAATGLRDLQKHWSIRYPRRT
ncbi:hypothetical protein ABS71_17800 [bacterium SCN 62-11]|nr:MAG: hypothetical protein ABS71_17800 [bacterium SCN 62-11]